MNESTTRISTNAAALRAEVDPSDELAKLTDRSVHILRESAGMRLLQAKDLGGLEAHPNDFFDWVIKVGAEHASAGWVAGVVGVHPWEISIMDPRVQEEIYGADPEIWVASPYAPFGKAAPVDGGFLFSGRWPYSTGTDHSDWVILGGQVTDAAGASLTPPDVRHFVLPRRDYTIVPDSWTVMGLRGTGSKDVIVENIFVPDHRVSVGARMYDGSYAAERRPGSPLFGMMFGVMFNAAIASGTFGIARGALRAFTDVMETRVSTQGVSAKSSAGQLERLAGAEADVDASINHVQSIIGQLYDHVELGGQISVAQRLQFRRDQVRATQRCIAAVDDLFRGAGSGSIVSGHPVERAWRDLHVAGTHVCNTTEVPYAAWGAHRFGAPIPANAQY